MQNRLRIRLLVGLLVTVHAAVILAGFFAPYDAKEQNRNLPYALRLDAFSPARRAFICADLFMPPCMTRTATVRIAPRVSRSFLRAGGFVLRAWNFHFRRASNQRWRSGAHHAGRRGRFRTRRILATFIRRTVSLAAGLLATLLTLAAAALVGTVSGFLRLGG